MNGGICIGSRTKRRQGVASIEYIVEDDGMTEFRGLATRWL